MILTAEERHVMTEVAKKFYEDLKFQKITKRTWMDLDAEEQETFIQGQKWLYGYYILAYRKGYEKGVDDSKDKLDELLSTCDLFGKGG